MLILSMMMVLMIKRSNNNARLELMIMIKL